MYKNNHILGLIPARGHSDEIDHLNIKELGEKPMIVYSIEQALKSKYLDRLMVSTEDTKTAEISKKYGAEVPFMRPVELSSQDATVKDVVRHTLDNIKHSFDIIVTLLPNAPFRTAEDIDNSIELLVENRYDSVVSVVEERGFFWIKRGRDYKPLTHSKDTMHRKNCTPLIGMNGGIQVVYVQNYNYNNFLGENIGFYIMKENHAMAVNSLYGLLVAERLIKLPVKLIDELRNSK